MNEPCRRRAVWAQRAEVEQSPRPVSFAEGDKHLELIKGAITHSVKPMPVKKKPGRPPRNK